MHSILWASILASAGVAVVTTLLVEYLAKPWLEVRKDRIVENDRQRRAAIIRIERAASLMSVLHYFIETIEKDDRYVEFMMPNAAEIKRQISDSSHVIDVPQSVRTQWVSTTSFIIGWVAGFQRKDKSPSSKGESPSRARRDGLGLVSYRLNIFIELFKTSKWHPLRRRRLISEIKSFEDADLEDAAGLRG